MYTVKIVNAEGQPSFRPHVQAGREVDAAHLKFRHYGDANRWAIDHASVEPGHITYVSTEENPSMVLVAYVSLSELKWGRVAMVDNICAGDVAELPAAAREQIAWFTTHYAKQAG